MLHLKCDVAHPQPRRHHHCNINRAGEHLYQRHEWVPGARGAPPHVQSLHPQACLPKSE